MDWSTLFRHLQNGRWTQQQLAISNIWKRILLCLHRKTYIWLILELFDHLNWDLNQGLSTSIVTCNAKSLCNEPSVNNSRRLRKSDIPFFLWLFHFKATQQQEGSKWRTPLNHFMDVVWYIKTTVWFVTDRKRRTIITKCVVLLETSSLTNYTLRGSKLERTATITTLGRLYRSFERYQRILSRCNLF